VLEGASIIPDSSGALSREPILDRPFYFIAVLWGERFRDTFLEYCVPSLLSAGNLPALSTRQRSKFLIATYAEDWAAMRVTPIFKELERYVEPVFIEIPPCPSNRSGCEHMGIGHKSACEMAYRAKAYAMVLTPDCMLSDGSIARLQDLARGGIEIVLVAALRFGEEPFLAHLREMGAIPEDSRRDSGRALTVTSRQMVYAAVNGLHSETKRFEWVQPYFAQLPSAAWWNIPGEDGMLVHSLSWAPLLLDYAAVPAHDTSTLENWTIDGDYLYKNLARTASIYVVQDSDEMFLASWAPLDERALPLTPNGLYLMAGIGSFIKGAMFREAFMGGIFDPLKQRIFFLPVRWHSQLLNDAWVKAEKKSFRTIHYYVDAPSSAESFFIITSSDRSGTGGRSTKEPSALERAAKPLALSGPARAIGNTSRRFMLKLAQLGMKITVVISRVIFMVAALWQNRRLNRYRLGVALRGNRDARRWVLWRIRGLGTELMGRPVVIPQPCLPPEVLTGWKPSPNY
jgi:hypothetical protein